jgi:hypothetical protein
MSIFGSIMDAIFGHAQAQSPAAQAPTGAVGQAKASTQQALAATTAGVAKGPAQSRQAQQLAAN